MSVQDVINRHLAYPLAKLGKIIGVPYSGTHTLGNWQSDNAVDIATPTGTPVVAIEDATVVKVSGSYNGGASRFDGYQVTLSAPDGGTFYTHLSEVVVKVGQKLTAGEVIGKSGAANGVEHLHLGREHGDPRELIAAAKAGDTDDGLTPEQQKALDGAGKTVLEGRLPRGDVFDFAKDPIGWIWSKGAGPLLTIALVFAGLAIAALGVARMTGMRAPVPRPRGAQ